MNVLRYAQNCTDLQSLPISGEVRVLNLYVYMHMRMYTCVYMHVYMRMCMYVYMCTIVYFAPVYMTVYILVAFSMLPQSVTVLKHYYKFHYCYQNISLIDTSRPLLR